MRDRKIGLAFGGGILALLYLAPAAANAADVAVAFFSGPSELKSYSCDDCGAPIASVDDSDTAVGFFVGYEPNDNIGVHLGYVNLNVTKASGAGGVWTDKLEAAGFFTKLRGTLPLGPAYAFVEAGMFFWEQKVTFASTSFSDSGTFSGNDPMFGVGAGYRFGRKQTFAVEGGWTRFQDVGTTDPELGHKNDIELIGISLLYRFGL